MGVWYDGDAVEVDADDCHSLNGVAACPLSICASDACAHRHALNGSETECKLFLSLNVWLDVFTTRKSLELISRYRAILFIYNYKKLLTFG